MAKFKAGDRARIRLSGPCDYPEVDGREVIVLDEITTLDDLQPQYWIRLCYGTDREGDHEGNLWESDLQKLLPDSDTYHPADISIDDLMRGLRHDTIKTPETVT